LSATKEKKNPREKKGRREGEEFRDALKIGKKGNKGSSALAPESKQLGGGEANNSVVTLRLRG